MTIYRANRRGVFPWLLAVSILAPLAAIPFLEGDGWGRAVPLLLLWLPAVLFGWIYLSTVYRIEGGHLVYRSGFLRGRIPIDGMQEIVSGTTLWVGMRPALARNGMIIQYRGYGRLYIAPESNQELIAHLLRLNPRIRVTELGGATAPPSGPPADPARAGPAARTGHPPPEWDAPMDCRRALTFLVLVGSLSGCGEAGPDGNAPSLVADTLESGRVMVQVAGVDRAPVWQLREVVRIGATGGDGPDLFGEIRDVELGPGGEVVVLDGQAAEVRVFAGDGAYLRTLGRQGQGPGELNAPAGMTLDRAGNVWVMNWRNARYTAFDLQSGEPFQEHQRLASFAAIPWPGAFSEGRLVDVGLDRNGDPAILLLDGSFVPRDTLPFPRADPGFQILIRRGDTPMMSVLEPFAPQPAWSPAPEGIVIGEGGRYRLHSVGFDGDTTRTVEVSVPGVPVSAAERDSVLADFRELVESNGGTPERQPRVPDEKPPIGAVLVDGDDRIWVRRGVAAGAAPRWDVIGPDGGVLAGVGLPDGMDGVLRAVSGGRVAVQTDLEGVPTVIVYEIVGGGD